MISIKKSQIPQYLKNSEFYNSLEKDGVLEIPKSVFKKDTKVKNISDFDHLLNTVHYFGVEYPNSLYEYYQNNSYAVLYLHHAYIDLPEKIEFFKSLLKLPIKNFEQFESNMKIYGLFRMDYSDEFIEHAFNNKRFYLKNNKFKYEHLRNKLLQSEEWEINFYHEEDDFFHIYKLENGYVVIFDIFFSLYEQNICTKYVEFFFKKEEYKKFKKYLKNTLNFILGKENTLFATESYIPEYGFHSIEIENHDGEVYIHFGVHNESLLDERERQSLNDNKLENFDDFKIYLTNFNKKIIHEQMESLFKKIILSIDDYFK